MKKIVLTPIKNEGWILEFFLKNISVWADKIIVADQNSTDDSLEICSHFDKVAVIRNDSEGHSNAVRWMLLDEARKVEGDNLIFFLDADEIISPLAVEEIEKLIEQNQKTAIGFSFDWIQLFDSKEKYRVDGVWKGNKKPAAFLDDRKVDFKRIYVINDHTSRIPELDKIYNVNSPLLHFNRIFKEKYEIKQIWYKMNEFLEDPKNVKYINNKYSVMSDTRPILENSKEFWFSGISFENLNYKKEEDWRYLKIRQWISEHGISFFDGLDIWENKDLRAEFLMRVNRQPTTKTYPGWIIKLNYLKNKIKNALK